MNNMNFEGYTYPDMNMINDMFMQNNLMNNMSNDMQSNMSDSVNGSHDLAQPYEGFLKGNMFENLYQQYKNYKPARLIPNNEQAELLLNVDQLCFAAHEIRLYLDVNPDDKNMIRMFNEYQTKANEMIKMYEEKYGPILTTTTSKANKFCWEAYAWPWEMEEM